MAYKKILTIQDISCVGQCSLTVALPILSACGMETCILPSAVLSTHTAGFTDFTVRDLADDMPAICEHWVKENIKFDAICTGYLGGTKQIDYVKKIIASTAKDDSLTIIDPAMADNGKLYPAFDMEYVEGMKGLCAGADILLPNITEACFLTDIDFRTEYDSEYIEVLLNALEELGAKTIVLTGVGYQEGKTGVIVRVKGETKYYEHEKIVKSFHGTGDVYAAAFIGSLMNGKSVYDSAKIAADYTAEAIRITQDDKDHWYGVKFEKVIPQLIEMIK